MNKNKTFEDCKLFKPTSLHSISLLDMQKAALVPITVKTQNMY